MQTEICYSIKENVEQIAVYAHDVNELKKWRKKNNKQRAAQLTTRNRHTKSHRFFLCIL